MRNMPAMWVVGAVLLVLVGGYYLFMAVDGMGLASAPGSATVTGKEYREAGTTYTRTVIGARGQSLTLPQAVPEMYILKLVVHGKETECAVTRELYESLEEGTVVDVTYEKRRITGQLQVTRIGS